MKPSPSHQLSLFDTPAVRLRAVGQAVKIALNKVVGESSLSREEIVYQADALAKEAGVNLCPGGVLSLHTFNKWLDIKASGSMPSVLGLTALGLVLGFDASAFEPPLEALGKGVMGPNEKNSMP